MEDASYAPEAVEHLNTANRQEPDNSFSWFQLAKAHTMTENTAMAALASTEYAAITGRARDTMKHAHYARQNLEEETPSWYRAQDLYMLARNAVEDSYRKRGKKPPPMPGDPEEGDPEEGENQKDEDPSTDDNKEG